VVVAGVAEAAGELEHVAVGYGDAGEHHRSSVHVFVSGWKRPNWT
jgi:hypothetical protein